MIVKRKSEISAFEQAKADHEAAEKIRLKGVERVKDENKKEIARHAERKREVKKQNDQLQRQHSALIQEHEAIQEGLKLRKAMVEAEAEEVREFNNRKTTKLLAKTGIWKFKEVPVFDDEQFQIEPPMEPPVVEIPDEPELVLEPEPLEFTWPEPDTYSVTEVRKEKMVPTPHGDARAMPGTFVLTNTRTKEKFIIQKSDLLSRFQEVK